VNNLVGWAHITGMVRLKSDGTPWRPIVHIEDISRAFLALAEAPRELVHNQAFNVGRSEENYQIRDIAKIVMETVPGSEVTFAEDAGPDKRCYRVTCEKICSAIPGYTPMWTARLGAEQLYEAYKRFGLTLADFEGPRFMRIHQVKKLQSENRLDSGLRWASVPAAV
jgi:nucleoside-diphosphate-sugar epimerase